MICNETFLRDISDDHIINLNKYVWDAIEISKYEIEKKIKSGTNIIEWKPNQEKKIPPNIIGIIISPPYIMNGDYYYINHLDDTIPNYSISGFRELIELLWENLYDILGMRIFLIPESCKYFGESFPDGHTEEEIDLKYIHFSLNSEILGRE